MAKVFLRGGKESRLTTGHPWIFASDIDHAESQVVPGSVVSVCTAKGRFLARAVYNPASQIALRLLTREDIAIDAAFIRARVERALDYRRAFADLHSCRLIFAESDGLPGITADSFGDLIVLQCISLGMEPFQATIAEALNDLLSPAGIYERNDIPVRELEGLPQRTGLIRGQVPELVRIQENGIAFDVDVRQGQKTGYFLDQKENRAAIAPFVQGASVLDCCTHTGSFALHAAHYGAARVRAVDISEQAIQSARHNAAINHRQDIEFVTANIFDYLKEQDAAQARYDVVILDPPAFAKAKSHLPSAVRGYKEINLRALKILRDGGYLVTCSCSQHVVASIFRNMILEAAQDARVQLMQVEFRSQGRDHPILPAAIETHYLKCGIYRVFK